MRIVRCKDYNDMSRKAANIISAQVILNPKSILGLATGSTPIGAYAQLIKWYEKGDVDFSQVETYNLDEYRGLTHEDPQSYHYFMRKNFFDGMPAPPTTRWWQMPASAISSSSASATMATSASTSRMTCSARARTA